MKVTEVNLTPIKPHDGLVAFASCVIDGAIFCGSIAIRVCPDGTYRLLYPTKKMGNSNMGVYHPINRAASKAIENAIFEKCNEVFNQGSGEIVYGYSTNYD